MVIATTYTGMNYTGGRWKPAESTFEDRNPVNADELLGVFPRSGAKAVGDAVTAAHEAFPAWRGETRIRRAEYLDNIVQLVKADQEELARLISRECGKSISEARADVIEGIHTAQYWFGQATHPFR